MATISLSPTPVPLSAMSSRRVPLTSNPNVANSPLRGASALASFSKQKRSYANLQREEPYGQPPPTKKQALDNGTTRAPRSPSKLPRSQLLIQRGVPATSTARTTTRERSTKASTTSRGVPDDKEVWKKHYRAKFPKMVFYFESIPDDIRAKLTKRVTYLGAVCLPQHDSLLLQHC
jgi:regulatory subunit for Cdc7p protein kinase